MSSKNPLSRKLRYWNSKTKHPMRCKVVGIHGNARDNFGLIQYRWLHYDFSEPKTKKGKIKKFIKNCFVLLCDVPMIG